MNPINKWTLIKRIYVQNFKWEKEKNLTGLVKRYRDELEIEYNKKGEKREREREN